MALRQKTDFGFYNIELYIHQSYDLKREQPALEIRPVYGVRFDSLMTWFEKYSFKSSSDQRNNSTSMADGKTLESIDKFYFLDSRSEFDKDFISFTETVRNISTKYFSKYKSIENFFTNDVLPFLNRKQEFSDVGADWIFEYLAAVKLCQFERFDEMAQILRKQIEFMKSRNEPNVTAYYDKFDDIFEELRTLDLK